MPRISALPALLGLVWAAAGPAAAQQKEVTLFGRKYSVVSESRAQTYKNGLKVVIPNFDASNRKANLWFTQGADASQDRLFVVAPITPWDETVTGHRFYLLTGTDANGVFSAGAATLTEFFGGNVNGSQGGVPFAVMHLNDEHAGTKVDRNLLLAFFTRETNTSHDIHERYYDLDTLSGAYQSSSVAVRPRGGGSNEPASMVAFAPGPGGTAVVFGLARAFVSVEVGVVDPQANRYFPVLTNLGEVTKSASIPFPQTPFVHSAFLYGGDPGQGTGEYWLLVSSSMPWEDGDSTGDNQIWRVRLRFPADLATATRGSIQAEVLGPPQELKGTPLHSSDGGVFGMAVGREVAPGLRRLYFADWQGNLYTATPLP